MLRSLVSVLEEVTLLVLPHGGQKTARRNAWRAAADLHVTTGYRWIDPVPVALAAPGPAAGARGARGAGRTSRLAGQGGGATTTRIGSAVRGLPRIVAVQS